MRAPILALALLAALGTTADAQTGGVQVHAENPEAPAPFVDAQATGLAPTAGTLITGVTQSYSDVDTYRFQSLASVGLPYGGLIRQFVWGRYPGQSAPNTGSLWQRVGDRINHSRRGVGDKRPVSYALIGVNDQLLSVVATAGADLSADSTSVVNDSDGGEPAPYELFTLFRPQTTQVALEATDVRDVRNVSAVYDCSVDLTYWYYRDLDLSTTGEPGEARRTAFQLPEECWDQGFNFSTNTPMTVAILDAITAEQYFVRKYDENDSSIPSAPGVQYRAHSPIIPSGELRRLIPSGRSVVIFYGILGYLDRDTLQMDPDNPFAIGTAKSADPVRASLAAIENIHPGHTWANDPIVVAKVSDADSVTVTLDVASATQVAGYQMIATRDQPGRYGQRLGSVVFSDTIYVPTLFHAPDGYDLTTTHPINDLRPGESVTVTVTPLGRGLYYDTDVVGAPLTATYQVQVGTAAGDGAPGGSGLAVRLYPNPSAGQATAAVRVSMPGEVSWAVTDALGRQVASGRALVASGEVDVPLGLRPLAAGVYAVRVQQAGEVAVRRLTVVR